MNDDKLRELYDNFLQFADDMCADHGAMEVAAIMMAQALTIYKSAMSDEDYNRMVDSISASRAQVKTFQRPVMQ